MASRRYFTLFKRHYSTFITSKPPSFHSLKTLTSLHRIPHSLTPQSPFIHSFSSRAKTPKNPKLIDDEYVDYDDNVEDEDEDGEDEEEDDYSSDEEVAAEISNEPANFSDRSYYNEDKIQEAADIGYKVVEPLKPGERVFKGYKPAFAVVQVGSHQFKVSNGDCIYVEKLKYCEVNDKLVLNKVLMAGSLTETMIGRPILPDVAVHAVVEEHALDAKVIIFKKKRRKNYRRTKGHRQELTRLRITNIQGIAKPKAPSVEKQAKKLAEKVEKEAVAA